MIIHQFRAFVVLLSVAAITWHLPLLAANEKTPVYQIDECALPVRITLHGLPQVPSAKLSHTLETCGKVENYPLNAEELESISAVVSDQIPRISITAHDGKFDVRIELRNDKVSRIYQATQVTPGAKNIALQRVGHESGPDLSISLARIEDRSYVRIHVVDSPANQVAQDIAKIKHVNIDHIERVTAAKFTAHFEIIPVNAVLEILADVSGIAVQRNGKNSFVFGSIKDKSKIEELSNLADGYRKRGDTAQLKRALEQIVALAKPNDADDIEVFVLDPLAELIELAITEKKYSHAEVLCRERLAQLERAIGTADSAEYAEDLGSLGRIRVLQNDVAGARAIYEKALAMIEKYEGVNSSSSIKLLREFAYIETSAENWEAASALNLRALKILDMADDPDPDALKMVLLIEGILSSKLLSRDEYALAQPHFERELMLGIKLFGENDPSLDLTRSMLGIVATYQGKDEIAAMYYARQIELSEQRADPISAAYAEALRCLAAIRTQQNNFTEAISLWGRVITLRKKILGPKHPRVIVAINELALLYRLSGQLPEAMATTKRADAIQPSDAKLPDLDKKYPQLGDELEQSLTDTLNIYFDDQLKTQQTQLAPNDVALAVTLERIGEVSVAMNHYGHAESKYKQAWAIRLKAQGIDHADTQRTAQRLIEFYERRGDMVGIAKVRLRMNMLK